MAVTLREYAAWLDKRELRWPAAPEPQPAKATPYSAPLKGIRAVTWSIYGTLVHIADGELRLEVEPEIRMQVALEKTIQEFNMWNSMTRRPGQPWEYMLPKYKDAIADLRMASTRHKGDVPEVNSARIWGKLLGMLEQKNYKYDEEFYGDFDELSEKVAFYFHRCLQGVGPAPGARDVLLDIAAGGLKQGFLADAQPFTVAQMLRVLEQQGTLPPLTQLFTPGCAALSFQEGVRKPSATLFERCLEQFRECDVEPEQILHVGSRLADDLGIAKKLGFRTALYAGDKNSLRATSAEVKDATLKPDRLITDLAQLRNVLDIPPRDQ
jgi:FMN phosphatase YigB (HAD superfamily)